MNKPTKILLAAIGVLLLSAVVARLGMRAVERANLAMARLSGEEIEAYYRWKNEPIIWPEEALRAEPFPAELTSAAHALYRLWREADQRAIREFALAYSLSDPPALEAIEAYRELLDGFAGIAGHPDYDLTVFERGMVDMDDPEMPMEPMVDFLFVQMAGRLLTLRSGARLAAGDEAGAHDDAKAAARASRVGAYEALIVHLIAISVRSRAVDAWHSIVRSSGEPELLREALARQNELAAGFTRLPADLDAMTLDLMGGLRPLIRRGFDADIQGLTGLQFVEQHGKVRARYLREAVRPFSRDHPEIAEIVEEAIENEEESWEARLAKGFSGSEPWHRRILIRLQPLPFSYALAMPNGFGVGMRMDVAAAKFDLLRIETASKLFEIERGRAPAGIDELAPQYLPSAPVDPFSGDGGGYRRLGGRYHSVGPDGSDEGRSATYDPTNGSTSGGDVFLPPGG